MTTRVWLSRISGAAVILAAGIGLRIGAQAQSAGPEMLDTSLQVRTVVSGLNLPISLAFLGPNDFLVLEKDTGASNESSTAPSPVRFSIWA
jgi:hypothetical protein